MPLPPRVIRESRSFCGASRSAPALPSPWRPRSRSGASILEAPFTSAVAVAGLRYWYLPVRLLMKDQYRSDERIEKITAPVLILHGAHDHVVPFAMGERLFEQTKAPKHIVKFLDGDHEDLDARGALHAVGRFLAGDLDKLPHP